MTTVERALRVFIHDIRTPLGVAQGYLRLLQQDRLAGEARDQAYRQALNALQTLSRLTSDAERFVDDEPSPDRVSVPAQQLLDRVRVRLSPAATVEGIRRPLVGTVALPPDVDGLAEAIAGVLLGGADSPPAESGLVVVHSTDVELWFASGPATAGPLTGEPLDPWRGPGLAWAAGCRTVEQSGGRLWAGPGRSGGVGILFPIEATS